jgi:hypothetical protein
MQIELKELVELLNKPTTNSINKTNRGQAIVVLDRGFVYVGELSINGTELTITNAKNLRSWGTTQGLGELRNGPLSSTKLDVVGEVIAPVKSLIHYIPCKGF